MVAVARGGRSPANPRAKAASAARSGAAQRRPAPARSTHGKARTESNEAGGLGPKLALAIGALVIVGGAAASVVLSHREHAHAAVAAPTAHSSLMARLVAPMGFRLKRVDVQGGSAMAKGDILQAAQLTTNMPILGVDLDQLRQRVHATGWVKDSKVVRLLPDTIIIAVTPVTPGAVWQHLGVTKVVDIDGNLIGGADPARFPELPLVVGDGAADEAHNILPLLRQHPALMGRVDALVRVDDRRWDVRLKDGSLIQLPAIGEDSALIQLDQLDQKQHLLSLGFEHVDLRNPEAISVRPKPVAPASAPAGASAPPKQ